MFTLVICLFVVVAAFVVIIRTIDPAQPATHHHTVGSAHRRQLQAEADEAAGAPARAAKAPERVRTQSAAAPARPVAPSPARRLRSALLLALLLAAVGTTAALAVGLLIVVLVTVLRTAIG